PVRTSLAGDQFRTRRTNHTIEWSTYEFDIDSAILDGLAWHFRVFPQESGGQRACCILRKSGHLNSVASSGYRAMRRAEPEPSAQPETRLDPLSMERWNTSDPRESSHGTSNPVLEID